MYGVNYISKDKKVKMFNEQDVCGSKGQWIRGQDVKTLRDQEVKRARCRGIKRSRGQKVNTPRFPEVKRSCTLIYEQIMSVNKW